MGWVRDEWAAHKVRKGKHGTFRPECLPKVIGLALGEHRATTVKSETIYATMQPPLPASTGTDGVGSASGVLEAWLVMVKSSTKKSIGVIVWCVV